MGDAQVLPVKVIWDYTYYWALLAPLFFAGKLTNLPLLRKLRPQFLRAAALNRAMQALLRDWGERNAPALAPRDGRLLDQYAIDWFHEMNRALNDPLDDDAFAARIDGNLARMDWLAAEILGGHAAHTPGSPTTASRHRWRRRRGHPFPADARAVRGRMSGHARRISS